MVGNCGSGWAASKPARKARRIWLPKPISPLSGRFAILPSKPFPIMRSWARKTTPKWFATRGMPSTVGSWDPLDGTTNFVHQMPGFAVSVALERRGELIVGVIYDPIAEECFTAARDAGARLNGQPIRASRCRVLREALVAASLSVAVQRDSEEVNRFLEVMVECQALRRLGSAALNLAYLACGRLDGYWATSVKTWDVAAGILLAQEAGAVFTGIQGGVVDLGNPQFIGAATPELHEELSGTLARGAARP